ncbi:hypothetical protein GCM10028807_28070 [Spirosoma daeguense]
MKKDFTIATYVNLLSEIEKKEYSFSTFEKFLKNNPPKSVILRHDVDSKPLNSLQFARIQQERGITGVYYFRANPPSWNERVIREIAEMGHEIGYHYECLTTCKGNFELAIKDFDHNLTALRRLVPVSTICMHGSPLSKYDSRDLWKTYSYRDFGIIGEPYFDIDFSKVVYLTDTGRQWNGNKVSVRDKVESSLSPSFKNTDSLITTLAKGGLAQQIMFTFHPQRWSSNPVYWTQELILQSLKNVVKRYFYVE